MASRELSAECGPRSIARLRRRAVLHAAAAAGCVVLLNGCGLARPFQARPPVHVPRIVYLSFNRPSDPALVDKIAAFRDGLRELGYVEGQTITIELLSQEGKPELLAELVGQVVASRPDVIVTGAPTQATALKNATSVIPIVLISGDPVAAGLVSDVGHPGANVTGVSGVIGGLIAKHLQLLKEAVPSLARVAMLSDPAVPGQPSARSDAQSAARSLDLRLEILDIRGPDDVEAALRAAASRRAEALVGVSGPAVSARFPRIAEFALTERLATVGGDRELVVAGGLMSYGPDQRALWRRGASYVDRILKGAKPGDLPVEAPTKVEFVIHLGTARRIGLTIPKSMLDQATEVIQ